MREDLGKLLLRLAVAGLMLFHGVSKLAHGIAGIVASVEKHSLPAAFAYGVYIGEVVAPLFVLFGFATRPAAIFIALNMLVAVWLSHASDVFGLGKGGGYALELQALYGIGAVVVALLGPGRFSISRGKGRWP